MLAIDAGGHTFSIPVMGVAFTSDSPLRLARYGISSVVSLVDDLFLEAMRAHASAACGEAYVPIPRKAPDGRARRVTAYLDFLDRQVTRQVKALRALPFEEGSDLCRYFELLPDGPLRGKYLEMLACEDGDRRHRMQASLRRQVVPGTIDANIMTKLDRDRDAKGRQRAPGQSDALAAARGFARSTVDGSLVLSAGMNPRLFAYLATLEEFQPDEKGTFRKRLVLKVSDFRSAEVQSKVLAKKGVWVSEYRIESGLNCGGHAFATPGLLMGPTLEEFREKREALADRLMDSWNEARKRQGLPTFSRTFDTRLTYQGGLGTAEEQRFLLDHYGIDGTGWGTPFLLVPEATNVDAKTRQDLTTCRDEDVQLGENSPLGVPFWNFVRSASEVARRDRIARGRPGSACPKGYLAVPWDFQEAPLCRASRAYQRRALDILERADLALEAKEVERAAICERSCICHDLSGCATLEAGIDEQATPAVCPGPNIVHFDRILGLDEMVGHIYGRCDVLARRPRPHMFLSELELCIEDLERQIAAGAQRLARYEANLRSGIDYYRKLATTCFGSAAAAFLARLEALSASLPHREDVGTGRTTGAPAVVT
ncbi:MAG: hypothetical protein ACC662_02020 [Planctomycetota bacterium]